MWFGTLSFFLPRRPASPTEQQGFNMTGERFGYGIRIDRSKKLSNGNAVKKIMVVNAEVKRSWQKKKNLKKNSGRNGKVRSLISDESQN